MARIAGVNIPTNKRVVIALTYIHGIGPAKSIEICEKVGIEDTRRVQDLSDADIANIRDAITDGHIVEGSVTIVISYLQHQRVIPGSRQSYIQHGRRSQ